MLREIRFFGQSDQKWMREMTKRILTVMMMLIALMNTLSADWKDDLQSAVRGKYAMTKTGVDRLRITQPGTIFVLTQEGVRADLATDLTLFANKIAVGKEGIAQASGLAATIMGKETSRALEPGEQMYLYDADVSDKEVKFQLITTKTYQVTVKGSTKEMRYKAFLVFQFESGKLQTMNADEVFSAMKSVLTTKDEASAPKTPSLVSREPKWQRSWANRTGSSISVRK